MRTGPDVRNTADLREAMARFASGVTLVTTRDERGQPWGLTASAFCSLSVQPPMVLVCIDRGADCHPIFARRPEFLVSILQPHHRDLALRFATKGVDKFASGEFVDVGASRLPGLPDALALVECRVRQCHDGGDHTILVGGVVGATVNDGEPLIYFSRSFAAIASPDGAEGA